MLIVKSLQVVLTQLFYYDKTLVTIQMIWWIGEANVLHVAELREILNTVRV
jgi:hypothetical protein